MICLVEVLRGEQDIGAVGDQRPDHIPELEAAARIEPRGRLIEEQEFRTRHETGAEVEAAAHAAGIRTCGPVGRLGEPHLLEHRRGVAPGIGCRGARESSHHHDVLPTGHRGLHGGGLPGQRHEPAYRCGVARDVDAVHAQAAGIRTQQRRDKVDEGRLAGAVRTEQCHDLALLHRQVQPVQGMGLAESLDEVGCLQGCRHL